MVTVKKLVLIPCVIVTLFLISWCIVPHSLDFINITDYLLGFTIPIYPKATQVVREGPCQLSYTLDTKDLTDVKSFYDTKFNSPLFEYIPGRSSEKKYSTGIMSFSNFYRQRFTFDKSLVIDGGVYSNKTEIHVKCEDYPPLG